MLEARASNSQERCKTIFTAKNCQFRTFSHGIAPSSRQERQEFCIQPGHMGSCHLDFEFQQFATVRSGSEYSKEAEVLCEQCRSDVLR